MHGQSTGSPWPYLCPIQVPPKHRDSTLHAGAQIYGIVQSQARTLAYVDVIWILVALTGCLIPLPFLMKRPTKRQAPAEMVH